jgi:hypothetical protein
MSETVYVVMRDDHRVSDREYLSYSDAAPEQEYWKEIVSRSKDGTKVTIKEKQRK